MGSQAVTVNVDADRAVCDGVRFLGNQDTLLAKNDRGYYVNTYVAGTEDFIFGGAVALFTNCTVHAKASSGGTITAASTPSANPYGSLIYKSAIIGTATSVTTLGRPWGAAAQVRYSQDAQSVTIATAQPWINMSSNSWKNARFTEYKNTGAGATVNSDRPQMSNAVSSGTQSPGVPLLRRIRG